MKKKKEITNEDLLNFLDQRLVTVENNLKAYVREEIGKNQEYLARMINAGFENMQKYFNERLMGMERKVDANTKSILGLEKKVDNNTNAILTLDKKVDSNTGAILDNKKAILDNKKAIFDNKKAILDNKKAIFDNKKAIFDNKKAILDNKKAIFDNKEEILDNKKAIHDNKKLICGVDYKVDQLYDAVVSRVVNVEYIQKSHEKRLQKVEKRTVA